MGYMEERRLKGEQPLTLMSEELPHRGHFGVLKQPLRVYEA